MELHTFVITDVDYPNFDTFKLWCQLSQGIQDEECIAVGRNSGAVFPL